MRKFFTVLVCLFMFQITYSQNAIVGSGFSTGWGTLGESYDFSYFSPSFNNSYSRTTTANGTGNQYFRLGIDWDGTKHQNTITPNTDVQVSPNNEYTLNGTNTDNGSMFINVSNTSHNYIFKTRNAGSNPSRNFIFFEVQGDVRTISSVGSSPATPNPSESVSITATLSGNLNTGQGVYLRYTTNNFSSSTVVEMTGSNDTYTSSIPAQGAGETVSYYVFTSGNGMTISSANSDFYTINLNNNGGSNYSYSVVLPVELTSFTAKKQANATQLNWSTSSEENNDFFTIEKSLDGENFKAIGTKAGAGNSLEVREYSFIDENPANGVNYYRLKQTDFDGKFSYSDVVSVEFKTKIQASIYPNPTSEKLTISTETQDVVNIRIFSVTGQMVYQNAQRIENQTEINLSELAAGNYFLMIADDATQKTIYSSSFVKD